MLDHKILLSRMFPTNFKKMVRKKDEVENFVEKSPDKIEKKKNFVEIILDKYNSYVGTDPVKKYSHYVFVEK